LEMGQCALDCAAGLMNSSHCSHQK